VSLRPFACRSSFRTQHRVTRQAPNSRQGDLRLRFRAFDTPLSPFHWPPPPAQSAEIENAAASCPNQLSLNGRLAFSLKFQKHSQTSVETLLSVREFPLLQRKQVFYRPFSERGGNVGFTVFSRILCALNPVRRDVGRSSALQEQICPQNRPSRFLEQCCFSGHAKFPSPKVPAYFTLVSRRLNFRVPVGKGRLGFSAR